VLVLLVVLLAVQVTKRAKKRGLPQLGTLGAGNHYAEIQVRQPADHAITVALTLWFVLTSVLVVVGGCGRYMLLQVVDEIFDKAAASRMGIEEKGQVCIMIHSGSRGLGHQVATGPCLHAARECCATCDLASRAHHHGRGAMIAPAADSLVEMEKAMARDGIVTNDRQLACARISSTEGQTYLAGMAAAANYAWVNRSSMTFLTRQAFSKVSAAAMGLGSFLWPVCARPVGLLAGSRCCRCSSTLPMGPTTWTCTSSTT